MSAEAKLKLSVDSSQAQKEIRLIDQQMNEIGGKSKIGVTQGSASGSDDMGSFIELEKKFIKSFDSYMSQSNEHNQKIINKLESLENAMKGSSGNSGGGTRPPVPPTSSGGGNNSNPTPSNNNPDNSSLGDIVKKAVAGGIALKALGNFANFANQGSRSSKQSEMQAYDIYNTLGLYDNGNYDTARSKQANTGSPYGYDTYATLGMQSTLVGMTGATSQENITADTQSALKTSRALSINENQLTSTFGSMYQNGTYGNGDMSKFANTFATTLKDAGMTGREDEQLDILQSIADSLDQNLTTISQGQYNNALGLYSMFSASGQAMTGEESANLTTGLNNAITGGDTAMDVLLGRYQTGESSWQFSQRKEKGITDTDNLSYILQNIEGYTGYDLNSDLGKQTLFDVLNKNGADVSTEEVQKIIDNKDAIINGTYAEDFGENVESGEGSSLVDKEYGDYDKSKLADMNTYEAESLNAQEEIGNAVNEVKSKLEAIYNDMPQWLQNTTTGTGGVIGGVTNLAGGVLTSMAGNWLGNKLGGAGGLGSMFGKFFSGGATTAGAGAAGTTATSGVAGLLGGSADDIAGAAAGSADDIAGGVASGLAGSADDIAGAAAGGLGGASKAIPIVGSLIQGGIGIYKYSQADNNEEKGDAVGSTVGGIGGGLAGAAAGAAAGGALGLAGGPLAIATALGGAILGGLGGLAGSKIGGSIGSSLDEEDPSTEETPIVESETTEGTQPKIVETLTDLNTLLENTNSYLSSIVESESYTDSSGEIKDPLHPDYKSSGTKIKDVGKMLGTSGLLTGNVAVASLGGLASGAGSLMERHGGAVSGGSLQSSNPLSIISEATASINELTSVVTDIDNLLSDGMNGSSGTTILPSSDSDDKTPLVSKFVASSTGTTSSTSNTGSNSKKSGGLWSKFKSFFGFGSNATGNDYVPFDGYIDELHKGEMVLDKHDAQEYRSGNNSSNSKGSSNNVLEIKISGSVDGMNNENQTRMTTAVIQQLQALSGNNSMLQQLANNTIRINN